MVFLVIKYIGVRASEKRPLRARTPRRVKFWGGRAAFPH